MTLREQIHDRVNHLDEGLLQTLLRQLNKMEERHFARSVPVDSTLALWKAFAEPISDAEEKATLEQTMERRSLFGSRLFDVQPD